MRQHITSTLLKGLGLAAVWLCLSNSSFAQLTITTTTLADGHVGPAYTAQLTSSGGVAPYTWSIVAGSLPGGLSLTAGSGQISGNPTISGKFDFKVRVTDSTTPTALAAEKDLSIRIVLDVTTSSLPNGLINTAYSQTLTATPTIGVPVQWALTSGSLPTGFAPLASDGTISGTATASGTFN